MDNNELEAIRLHIAGATVRHHSPFDSLKSFKNDFELTQDFIDKWVRPYYMEIGSTRNQWIDLLKNVKSNITVDVIQTNLGNFDWRTRQTGAFFSAITNQTQFIDIIGTHLLKSEVCYAGTVYCEVLASFNSPKCVEFLNLYLDYYLSQPDLWFDQQAAMEAILYLDNVNATNHFAKHLENWNEFIKNKPSWKKEIKTGNFEKKINLINSVRKYTA